MAAAGARVIIPADLDYPRLLAALGSVGPGLILLRGGNYSEAESLECIRRVLRRIPLDELPKFIVVGRPGKNPATVASSLIWVPGAAWSPYPKGPALAGYARPGVLVAGKKDVKAFAFDECEQRAVFDAAPLLATRKWASTPSRPFSTIAPRTNGVSNVRRTRRNQSS